MEEDPNEKLSRLERHEELLQKKEHRLSTRSRPDTGGGHGSSSVGQGFGEFFATLGDHKFIVIGVIAVAVIAYMLLRGGGSSSTTPANQSPDYSNSGYLNSNVSTALDQINAQLEMQGKQIGLLTNPPPGTSTGPLPPGPNPSPNPKPKPFSWLGEVPLGSKVWAGNNNSDGSRRWWFTPQGSTSQYVINMPKGSTIWKGENGRWWYKLLGGKQIQLTDEPGETDFASQVSAANAANSLSNITQLNGLSQNSVNQTV